MEQHNSLFNSLFDADNWVFTCSTAVVIYALKYAPEMVNMLDEP